MLFERISKKNKYGFSLFEVVVTMSIIAIFIAAASNVFTQKYKRKVALPAHGRFECYYDNTGTLTQRYMSENVVVNDFHPGTEYCTFEPKKAAAYLVINAVGGGGAGGVNYGGSAGEYQSVFLTTTTHNLKVYPGKGAEYNPDTNLVLADYGGDTYITDDDSNNREVIRMKGGRSQSGDQLLVDACRFAYSKYTCRREPFCRIYTDTKQIEANYCSCDGDSLSCEGKETLSFSTVLSSYNSMDKAELTEMILTYSKTYDTGQYLAPRGITYTLAIEVSGNFTGVQQTSKFQEYIDALDLAEEEGVGSMDPTAGSGGGRQQSGGHGAVVIAW